MTDADAFINPAYYSRTANPYLRVRDENGDYVYDKDIEGYSGRHLDFNFVEEMNNTDYTLKNRSIKPMISIDYKVASWLKLQTQFSMQLEHTASEKIADQNTYYV